MPYLLKVGLSDKEDLPGILTGPGQVKIHKLILSRYMPFCYKFLQRLYRLKKQREEGIR